MNTPDINHRYAGWRESVKLVSQIKGMLADVYILAERSLTQTFTYNRTIQAELSDAGVNLVDQTQSTLQRARLLLNFLRRSQ